MARDGWPRTMKRTSKRASGTGGRTPAPATPRSSGFKRVEAIGRTLPDVEVTTSWGSPSLKVRGKMFVCMAAHKSAEPNSLVVMMDFPDRDALLGDDPKTYYLKEHYVGYPCIVVRLARVHPDALRDLVISAHRYVSEKSRKKKPLARARKPRTLSSLP
jgi:hypothetical protein